MSVQPKLAVIDHGAHWVVKPLVSLAFLYTVSSDSHLWVPTISHVPEISLRIL